MVLRNVIRQLGTPDRLRGRMTGINMVFFQGGPQLDELEAGVVAQWNGPRGSGITGGVGCLIAVAWMPPAHRRAGHIVAASLTRVNEADYDSMVR